jgi:hypothetical protein
MNSLHENGSRAAHSCPLIECHCFKNYCYLATPRSNLRGIGAYRIYLRHGTYFSMSIIVLFYSIQQNNNQTKRPVSPPTIAATIKLALVIVLCRLPTSVVFVVLYSFKLQ